MFFCGLSATLVAFRLGALPALVRGSSGVVGGGRAIRGSSFRFPFPFRASRRAPGGKVRSWWAPREPSRAGGLGRVAGVRLARWRRANRGPVTVIGVATRGRRFSDSRGFPRRRVSFALFARKSKLTNSVVFASFLIRRGPHALYRMSVFRPRAAALFSRRRGSFLPRRGLFPGRRPGPAPGARHRAQDPLSHFALQKSDRRGQLSRFASQKSDQRGRLFHFALQKSRRPGPRGPRIPGVES